MPSGSPIYSLLKARASAEEMHRNAIFRIRNQNAQRIRIAFIIIHASVWKYHGLLQTLKESTWAEPLIIVAPYIAQGTNKMLEDLASAIDYAKRVGVQYYIDNRLLEGGDPYDPPPDFPQFDIAFFSNPHRLTTPPYYTNIYLNYPSCYVPYSYGMGYLNMNFDHYNQEFHNCMWRIYVPLNYHKDVFERSCASGSKHVRVTGYPGIHDLLLGTSPNYLQWQSDGRKKIIWAPHHTIYNEGLPLSNFLRIHELMLTTKQKYRNHIEWAFRPHPLLKYNLVNIGGWSKNQVEDYWAEWENDSHISTGNYVDLFASSDAIIHDSASFLVEYLYTGKPALYIDYDWKALGCMNEVGAAAYENYDIARSDQDLDNFITRVISNQKTTSEISSQSFISDVVLKSAQTRPEDNIVDDLRHALFIQ